MAYQSTHGDGHSQEENSGLPRFVGGLGLLLLVFAVLVAILALTAAGTHPAYFQ